MRYEPQTSKTSLRYSLNRLRINRQSCHPEEPQAVLSATKEGPLQLPDSENAEVLRFAQNDSA
jgi:hypothetical protein